MEHHCGLWGKKTRRSVTEWKQKIQLHRHTRPWRPALVLQKTLPGRVHSAASAYPAASRSFCCSRVSRWQLLPSASQPDPASQESAADSTVSWSLSWNYELPGLCTPVTHSVRPQAGSGDPQLWWADAGLLSSFASFPGADWPRRGRWSRACCSLLY